MMALALALLLAAATPDARPEPGEVIAAAPDSDWRRIPAEELIGFETTAGTMVLQLAPDFAPWHVERLRQLVKNGAFNGGAITRVQENYVLQWSVKHPGTTPEMPRNHPGNPPEMPYERPEKPLKFTPLGYPDPFGEAGFVNGWPVARDRKTRTLWPVHCHAMVGVGRDMPPDIGDSSELYAVIGHAPRHLDRNLAIIGRIIDGFAEHTALKRGTGPLGTYQSDEEKTNIIKAYFMNPDTGYEYLNTSGKRFASYRHARANRGSFFIRPAGTIDVCNVPVPLRKVQK